MNIQIIKDNIAQLFDGNGCCEARPSGSEDIYKIYAESFLNQDHLKKNIDEAQSIVNAAL